MQTMRRESSSCLLAEEERELTTTLILFLASGTEGDEGVPGTLGLPDAEAAAAAEEKLVDRRAGEEATEDVADENGSRDCDCCCCETTGGEGDGEGAGISKEA